MMWPYEIEDEALLAVKTTSSKSEDPFENDIYFVNNSGQTIDKVCYSMGGFVSADEDILTMNSESRRCYKDVKQGEAVRFDYTNFFDLDIMISYYFQICASHLEKTEVSSEMKKGGVSSAVLLWADLPEPFKDPDDPTLTLDAIKAARKYVSTTGKPLPVSTLINKGDLYFGAGDIRLRREGIHLKRTPKRGGKVMLYEFENENGEKIFHAITLNDAIAFIETLKQK